MIGSNGTLSFGPGIGSTAGFLERAPNKDSPGGQFADKILRGELSAVEAYEKVLQKFAKEPPHHIDLLRSIRDEHEMSVIQVRQIVREEGFEPSEEPGMWGTLVGTALDAVSLIGEAGALRLLKTGEEHGLNLYHEAMERDLLFHEKRMIRDILIPRQERHILKLTSLLTTH